METLSKAPDQDTYEKIFFPPLSQEGGALTSPYIQTTSVSILLQDFARITAKDALEYVGSSKPLKSKYAGKYLFELGEEERKGIIGMCMSYTTGNIVSKLVGDSTKNITAGLEKVLAEAEKAEEKK